MPIIFIHIVIIFLARATRYLRVCFLYYLCSVLFFVSVYLFSKTKTWQTKISRETHLNTFSLVFAIYDKSLPKKLHTNELIKSDSGKSDSINQIKTRSSSIKVHMCNLIWSDVTFWLSFCTSVDFVTTRVLTYQCIVLVARRQYRQHRLRVNERVDSILSCWSPCNSYQVQLFFLVVCMNNKHFVS